MKKLSPAQIQILKMAQKEYPSAATIIADDDLLSAMRDAGLIEEYDMWEDGTRRWTITTTGRAALSQEGGE